MLFGKDGKPSLPSRLHVALVVASNTIPHCDKIKLVRIKNVVMTGRHLQQPFCQPVVVLLLLCRVVKSRMTQVFVAIRNQEPFQLNNTG